MGFVSGMDVRPSALRPVGGGTEDLQVQEQPRRLGLPKCDQSQAQQSGAKQQQGRRLRGLGELALEINACRGTIGLGVNDRNCIRAGGQQKGTDRNLIHRGAVWLAGLARAVGA